VTVTDPWGLPISCAAEVAPMYGEALRRFHDQRSGEAERLAEVVRQDPGFAVGHATAALMAAFGSEDFDAQAEMKAAEEGRADHDWERSFVAATRHLVDEGMWGAQGRWLAHHDAYPADLVGMTVAAFTLLMDTDPEHEAEAKRRLERTMDTVEEDPALLGFLAMFEQDFGNLDRAHELAQRSLDLDPTGFAGGHPLSHVYFETGDHQNGLAWLDPWLATTDSEATFKGHLVWHGALHALALGDGEGALERYPHCGGSNAGGMLIDGPSLLWRCQLLGHVPSGTDPLDPRVSTLAAPLMDKVPFTFVGVHVALALATAGDADGLRQYAHNARGFDAPGAAEILPGLANGLAAYVEGDHARAVEILLPLEQRLWQVGGSRAQREVFEDTLIHALIRAQRYDEAATRLQVRLDRREGPLDQRLLAETVSGGHAILEP
jgi:tetratricopeptide (TPR) repeat protein